MSVADSAQIAAAIAATIVVPLWLGARHVHPLVFLVFAPFAGLVLTLGVRFTRRVRAPFHFDRFVREAAGRALVIFLVGGLVFILAHLIFEGGPET